MSDFLVELPFTDQLHNLLLSNAKLWVEWLIEVLGDRAAQTDSFAVLPSEFPSAFIAVSRFIEFDNVRHWV